MVSVASVTWVAPVCSQELGRIYVAVSDEDGRPVTDLGPDEFRVVEEVSVAEIVSAEIGTEPMKIALLVDNGGRISRGHGVRETWDRRFDGDEAWPVFVAILTDANEVSAFMNEDRYMALVNVLRFAGVVVHSVVWSSRGRNLVRGSVPADFAINLSRNTGGRFVSISAATALGDILRQLAADMTAHYEEASTRYRVLYRRPDPPGEHVSVRVTRPRVNLRLFGDLGLP